MEFRLLGPLEVESDGSLLRIAGAKERALLALLLVRANRLVSRDVLVDELWGERPPATARHTLGAYVSRLRKALAAGGGGSGLVESLPGGYCLRLQDEQLDVLRFERLFAEGRAALANGMPEEAEAKLSAALALWRGDALADLAFEPFAASEAARLEELRLAVVEARAGAALALGRHAELVGELQPLVAAHPLREGLSSQLMLALYRSGRQADALTVYRDARRRLVDELGIEPARELHELQQAILQHDPELDPPAAATEASTAPIGEVVPAAAPDAPREQRKVVTVVFCDVSESTALGERLDPEALRALLARYFERMRAIVERHGGTVEKFIGDAVMAVFGVPRVHEDDALRACRAAVEMRDALPDLGIEARIGVTTGEVVTGTEERLATGAAVNLAARLQQAAQPGEILIDAESMRLVGALGEVEPVEPLLLKGKAERVTAQRLLVVSAESPVRRLDAPMVGRATELRRLAAVFAQVVHDRRCQLFTILGPAGIGKSRLTAEFLAQVEARVVQGRCLSYGEGITYGPVVEILEQLALRPAEDAAAAAIASLLGESEQPTSPQEIAWAFRKTLEAAAVEEPLVCVFDDLHWAEPTLLDLVEHVADLSRDAPILLLCLARPELLDRRSDWAGGKVNATTTLLEPLSTDETGQLLDHLLDDEPVAERVRRRIVAVAEGNPLFAEEMLAYAREGSDGEPAMPPSIQALLAARLDQLDPGERAVLERAAVEGKHFHRAGIEALAPEQPQLDLQLQALVRRELIRPARAELAGEQAFRFRHQLIRDAAYDSLPKAVRADLHHRFARWLQDAGASLVELDEVVGYHLEQACRYRRALDQPVPAELAAEAQQRLAAAGRCAHERNDFTAAVKFFRRARAILEPEQLDVALEGDLVHALFWSGELAEAYAQGGAAAERAAAAGDRAGELRMRLGQGVVGAFAGIQTPAGPLPALVEQALPLFEAADDHVALVTAYTAAMHIAGARWRPDDAAEAAKKCLHHARVAGLVHRQRLLLTMIGLYGLGGSTPVSEVLAWVDEQDVVPGADPLASVRAIALSMLGRFDEARSIFDDQRAWLADRGAGGLDSMSVISWAAGLELLAGEPAAAERLAKQACRQGEQMGERGLLSSNLAQLAETQYALDRLEDAEATVRRVAEVAASGDVDAQQGRRQVEAKLLARRGRPVEAERLARDAVAIADQTQSLNGQAQTYATLAEVLALAGKPAAARRALRQALQRYERKGNLVGAERARTALTELKHRQTTGRERVAAAAGSAGHVE